MLKIAAAVLLIATTASAQVILDPTTLTRTPPPPPLVSRDKLMKFKADAQEAEKHSKAHQCADKITAKGLPVTPENVAANCRPKMVHRGQEGRQPTMNELLRNPQ